MIREDIIRIAREATKEAPREDWNSTAWVFGDETLERFAALVASAEREACAKIADEYAKGLERNYSEIIADEIRARGQA